MIDKTLWDIYYAFYTNFVHFFAFFPWASLFILTSLMSHFPPSFHWLLLFLSPCPTPFLQMFWVGWKAVVERMPLMVNGVRMRKEGGLRMSSSMLVVVMILMKPQTPLLLHLCWLLTHCHWRPLFQPPPAPRAPLGSLTPALNYLLWVKSPASSACLSDFS